jgi:dipeptidyl-peptidase-3
VDDAAVVQLYADGFEKLPLREKTLIWHLYQAAVAGRDIFIDQKHRSALEMRGILDQIVAHPQGIDPAALAEVQRYTKLFWINNGPYNNLTARKFVLKTTPEAFAAAAKSAQAAGATFATQNGETLDAMLKRLQPMFFDPNVDPSVTTKAPPAGTDILTASANNLYAGGVTMADLKGFTEKNGLNSRLAKTNGRLVEEVYKIDGRYAKQIAEIVRHLEDAVPFATEPMQNALRALVQWYPHRRGQRPCEVRHRVGRRQGVARRHNQRLHRGVPRPARHQGQLGGAGLLDQPGEDGDHQEDWR